MKTELLLARNGQKMKYRYHDYWLFSQGNGVLARRAFCTWIPEATVSVHFEKVIMESFLVSMLRIITLNFSALNVCFSAKQTSTYPESSI